MVKMKIRRKTKNNKQTIGRMYVYIKSILGIFEYVDPLLTETIHTLELADLGNQQNISRIPAGIYQCKKRWSIRHGKHIHILDVPDRTWILIHAGNFYTDILGCILVGDGLIDINGDGQVDVINSKATLKKILAVLPDRFELEIFDEVE